MLAKIYELYVNIRPELERSLEVEPEEIPELERSSQLDSIIELRRVIVSSHSTEGHAYMGMYFECSWDMEHGLGVFFHKDRILAAGEGEMATWNPNIELPVPFWER